MAQQEISKVDDEELINLIEHAVQQSVGDWLNSSDLAREREKATYEYAGLPIGQLSPTGSSQIVDSSTTEVVEAYTAILSELILSNNKIAKFMPYEDTVTARDMAQKASDVVNYCIFKKNAGWKILTDWIKASLLWKNAVIRWDYIEDFEYRFEEYDSIDQVKLDELLSDPTVEIVGDLAVENEFDEEGAAEVMYVDVRLRRSIDKSRVEISLVPPENFRISRDSTSIQDAEFVGVQTEITRSDLRKNYPDIADEIEDWDDLGEADRWNTRYNVEAAARKEITGQEYWSAYSNTSDSLPTEANRELTLTEAWIRVDRDGDGIAELKRVVVCNRMVLEEEDVDQINLASLCPISIPHEFYGLSIADFTRSTTLANTAIVRGFLENVYLTNYSPKLADPNVVDFGALQNMRPKQLIATNGNPAAAVAPMAPETISPGTVPMMEFLQTHKEQATGMSKAAQGLNDTLYVSGNSEAKVSAVQNASQKRIQHIARTMTETGFKDLITGLYATIQQNIISMSGYDNYERFFEVMPSELPPVMDVEVIADVGDHSNASTLQKMQMVQQLTEGLQAAGAGMVIKQEAPALIAMRTLEAMDLNPAQYIEDFKDEEFQQSVAESQQQEQEAAQQQQMLEQRKMQSEIQQAEANVTFTMAQAENTLQDNVRQTATSIDKHFQEWEKLVQDAAKDGAQPPQMPDIAQVYETAKAVVKDIKQGSSDPMEQIQEIITENPQIIEQLMQMLTGGGQQ